ncbi:MAG TPA: hypothetical protein VHE12_05840 [bacterium]|nr:hypothetical protein [bacterium]
MNPERRSERQAKSAEQTEKELAWKRQIIDRQTKDMVHLVRDKAFLRFIGRWTKECGVHTAIESNESNDARFREGMRRVGERMLAEVKAIDFEAGVEAERLMFRDEQMRRRLIDKGEKVNLALYFEEKQ